jgi:hypothetical protein
MARANASPSLSFFHQNGIAAILPLREPFHASSI